MSTSPSGARRLPVLRGESPPKAPEGKAFAPFGPRPASADITSRLVALKARIFCEGLRIDDDLWRELSHEHHYRHKRAGLSQGRFFRLVDGDASTAVNAPVHEPFVRKSSLELRRGDGGTYRIHDAEGELCEAVPFAWPKWYERTCDDGTPMSLVVSAHCDTSLYSALYQGGCDYWQGDMMCQFCAMKVDQKSKWRDVAIIAEVCKVALEENADAEITLGGGTRLFPDKSAKHKAEGIAKLKAMVDIPVCVEMAAPDTDDWLDRLKDAGLASILMNLELWDEDVRRRVMPGKAAITRQRYLDALGYAAKILGSDQVSSQIIIGLEPVEATLAAVRAVADVGAIPLPVVFRPLPGTSLADVPTPPLAEVLAVFDETLAQMKRRTLDGAKTRSGCALCGACSAHR